MTSSRVSSSQSRVLSLAVAALASLLVATASAGVFASSAHAIIGSYCPATPGTTIGLNGGARCVGAYHSSFVGVSFRNDATSVAKCAVLKPNSDGSGGNVGGIAAACAGGTSIAYQATGGYGGYPTGINDSGNYHTGFWGRMEYV